MFAQLGYYICMPFAWLTRIFYNLTGSLHCPDSLHPAGEAGAASLPAQEQEEHASHEPYARQDQGYPDPLRQQ